jgi:predicted  nucleic acid-binding Zn-ribbon protein
MAIAVELSMKNRLQGIARMLRRSRAERTWRSVRRVIAPRTSNVLAAARKRQFESIGQELSTYRDRIVERNRALEEARGKFDQEKRHALAILASVRQQRLQTLEDVVTRERELVTDEISALEEEEREDESERSSTESRGAPTQGNATTNGSRRRGERAAGRRAASSDSDDDE